MAAMEADLRRFGVMDHRAREAEFHWTRQAVATERANLERLRGEHRQVLDADRRAVLQEIAQARGDLAALQHQLIPFTEEAVFQDVGIFRYHHPLQDAEAYKQALAAIQADMKDMARAGDAVRCTSSFNYNGSSNQGARLARDLSKLMLRAYNAEAENCLRVMKAGSVEVAKRRLEKTAEAVEKLGKLLEISINPRYRRLRERELELTADYLMKKEEEREAARAERERLREQAKLDAEIRRETERLEKERAHRLNVIASLREQGKLEEAEAQSVHVAELEASIRGLHERQANVRAGYVYVISNVGTFGPGVVKIGLTRRLDPRERIVELGDASVPFRYDTHVLFFSDDAVGIETALHRDLADRRVNQVNLRREFFYATPHEVRALLHKYAGEVLEFVEEPEASEYRLSRSAREAAGQLAVAPTTAEPAPPPQGHARRSEPYPAGDYATYR
jgi:hypothetical protein